MVDVDSAAADPTTAHVLASFTGQNLNADGKPEPLRAIAFSPDHRLMVLADQLDTWLERAAASCLQAFKSFANGLQADYDAVKAGITLPWSTGPVEGQINRLKMLKRQMFGRANIDLLKLRVLYRM